MQNDYNSLLAEWFQWFIRIVLQVSLCFCFVLKIDLFFDPPLHYSNSWPLSGYFSSVHLILRQYQPYINKTITAIFTCRTIPMKYWNHSPIQVNCCYRFIDMSRKQKNTRIILTTKHWNYSTCFRPKIQDLTYIDKPLNKSLNFSTSSCCCCFDLEIQF